MNEFYMCLFKFLENEEEKKNFAKGMKKQKEKNPLATVATVMEEKRFNISKLIFNT